MVSLSFAVFLVCPRLSYSAHSHSSVCVSGAAHLLHDPELCGELAGVWRPYMHMYVCFVCVLSGSVFVHFVYLCVYVCVSVYLFAVMDACLSVCVCVCVRVRA